MSVMVKVSKIQIENFKNVANGEIKIFDPKKSLENYNKVLGIYGQNGSGKTAIIDAFEILSRLAQAQKLPVGTDLMIRNNGEESRLHFTFVVKNKDGVFEVVYSVCIKPIEDEEDDDDLYDHLEEHEDPKVYVAEEEVKYRELVKGAKFKRIIGYSRKKRNDIGIKPVSFQKKLRQESMESFLTCVFNAGLAYSRRTSFLFRRLVLDALTSSLEQEKINILLTLKDKLSNNLIVIGNQVSSLILANLLLPIKLQTNSKQEYKFTLVNADRIREVKIEEYNRINFIFHNISKVLENIIPGLSIEVRNIGKQTLSDGTQGIRVEFLSCKEDRRIPLCMESDGIKKLISILGYLIAMYNDESTCIVIDELDAGIYEFLLGEIIKILNESGNGQLIFTSHNLRPLEVLKRENLVFTTTNPKNRYIKFKGIKETNNIRDVYIRAIQLGYEDGEIYKETDKYDIIDAFEEVGEVLYGDKE